MRGHRRLREDLVGARVRLAQLRRAAEAVDEQRGAARALGVREQVEHLQPGRVGEVGRVGVGGERERRVRRVLVRQVRGEVVEAAVVGGADESDALEQFLGRGGGDGAVVDEAEAVLDLGFVRGVRGEGFGVVVLRFWMSISPRPHHLP